MKFLWTFIGLILVFFLRPSLVLSDTVKLSVGLTVAPYVIKTQNLNEKESGFELDIVKESFALGGYKVEFIHQPLERTKISFKEKHAYLVFLISYFFIFRIVLCH